MGSYYFASPKLTFFVLTGFPWVTLGYRSFFETILLRIPLLCKERLGEVESWGHRKVMMGSAIECCGKATSPMLLLGASHEARPLLTKEGDSRTMSHTFYP